MRFWLLLAMLFSATRAWAQEDPLFPFNLPEPFVISSPTVPQSVGLPQLRQAVTMAVSPTSSATALLGLDVHGTHLLVIWDLRAPPRVLTVPAEIVIDSLSWHPISQTLFAAGKLGGKFAVMRLDLSGAELGAHIIWSGPRPVDHVLVGPRPFEVSLSPASFAPTYRLFFDEREANGENWIRAVGENGESPYVVSGKSAPVVSAGDAEENGGPPPALTADFPKLLAFHPSGQDLFVQTDNKCIVTLSYPWTVTSPGAAPCDGGSLEISPNGLLALHWLPGQMGFSISDRRDGSTRTLETDAQFLLHPRFAADGGGFIGVLRQGGVVSLRYQPETMPLADVADAWGFVTQVEPAAYPELLSRLVENRGFLTTPRYEDNTQSTITSQLYDFYEGEISACGGNNDISPRPYMVTTDAMWEVYAGAYEGLFGLVERHQAIPAFTKMVNLGANFLRAKHPNTRLAAMFAAAKDVLADDTSDPEAERVLHHHDGPGQILPEDDSPNAVNYTIFEPRGFYADTPELGRYFAALKYLSSLHLEDSDVDVLRDAPPYFLAAAQDWITAYASFIAPSREPDGFALAATPNSHPGAHSYLFPLGYAADNDVLYNTVDNRVLGRPLGSGLDVAAAFGSAAAWNALQDGGQFSAYADLLGALQKLQATYAQGPLGADPLYSPWLEALRTQWQPAPPTPVSGKLWDAKRLQTGLASWATLRHATVLVNEVSGAECGGPSMEQIIMRPPRGYVEPDPATFEAIAHLFDLTIAQWQKLEAGENPQVEQGVARRLAQSRDDALNFAAIARAEIAGQTLSAKNDEDIEYAGGTIGDNFKVFLSVARDDDALVQPDPIGKIAEVSGESATGFTEAAVGNVMEWDQIIPDYGHHDIVKGGVYSYFEFSSPKPLTDSDWRTQIPTATSPNWVAPFLFGKP